MRKVIWLRATIKNPGGASAFSNEEPLWSDVEQCIRDAFEDGGRVTLTIGLREDVDKLRLGSSLEMECHPNEYRIVYDPVTAPGEKTQRREWWEPGDTPFRGTTNFNDHEWDDRTVCRDLSVAKQMFRDFFDHGDLTESSLERTRSVWDRKPR